jgi:hypothetical protein
MPSPKLALATVVALSGSLGCSLMFVDKPPANHASLRYFDCTSSRLAPVADATLAGLMGLAALGSTSDTQQDARTTVEVSVLAAGALASAVYGFVNVGHCRDAKEGLSRRLLFEPPATPPAPFPAATVPFASRPAADPWLSAGPPPGADVGPPRPAAPPDPAGGADAGAEERRTP